MTKWNEGSIFENNPFIEGLFEYMESPRGQLADEVREVSWPLLEDSDVDAVDRKIDWEDGKRLSIDESVQRIHRECPECPVEMAETHLVSWLEIELAPECYSRKQLDESDRLTET